MIYQMNESLYKELQREKMTHSAIVEYANNVFANSGEIFGIETNPDGTTYVARRESIKRITGVTIKDDMIDRKQYYYKN